MNKNNEEWILPINVYCLLFCLKEEGRCITASEGKSIKKKIVIVSLSKVNSLINEKVLL